MREQQGIAARERAVGKTVDEPQRPAACNPVECGVVAGALGKHRGQIAARPAQRQACHHRHRHGARRRSAIGKRQQPVCGGKPAKDRGGNQQHAKKPARPRGLDHTVRTNCHHTPATRAQHELQPGEGSREPGRKQRLTNQRQSNRDAKGGAAFSSGSAARRPRQRRQRQRP